VLQRQKKPCAHCWNRTNQLSSANKKRWPGSSFAFITENYTYYKIHTLALPLTSCLSSLWCKLGAQIWMSNVRGLRSSSNVCHGKWHQTIDVGATVPSMLVTSFGHNLEQLWLRIDRTAGEKFGLAASTVTEPCNLSWASVATGSRCPNQYFHDIHASYISSGENRSADGTSRCKRVLVIRKLWVVHV
jgi:hypothetical protein